MNRDYLNRDILDLLLPEQAKQLPASAAVLEHALCQDARQPPLNIHVYAIDGEAAPISINDHDPAAAFGHPQHLG
jgi:hypothetical protein